MRTARGRMATRSTWLHFGMSPPAEGGTADGGPAAPDSGDSNLSLELGSPNEEDR